MSVSADHPVAVTGSTGAVGGRVARLLAAEGRALVLPVRDVSRAPRLPGATPVHVDGYTDGDALAAGLAGVRTLFMVSGRESADRVAEHVSAVDAAVRAGVRHVVYLSFLGASPHCTFTFGRDHWRTEQYIRASGLELTSLRDSLYLDVLPHLVGPDGAIRGPAGDGRLGAVAREDVAAVAAAVLRDPGAHRGATYDLTGPTSVSMSEVAEALSAVAGRDIRYVAESEEEAYASRASFGAPEFEVRGWVTSYLAIARGELDVVTADVERVAGRAPTGLRDWLDANPDGWAHLLPR